MISNQEGRPLGDGHTDYIRRLRLSKNMIKRVIIISILMMIMLTLNTPCMAYAEDVSVKSYMEQGIRAAYDNMHLIYEAYYDENGQLEEQPGGFVAVYQEWDKNWNLISRTYLGADGEPVNRVDGYAIELWGENGDFEFYDKEGNVVDKELVKAKRTGSTPGTRKYIGIGDYNNEVIALHQKLVDLGYYGFRPESPWSQESVDALKILQENMDWPVTGTVESVEQILSVENVVGKNLLLGTNKGTKNYSISESQFETSLEPAGEGVKVTILSHGEGGWLTLFYYDGHSRAVLNGTAGDVYTLSFDAKSNTNANIFASHMQGNAQENQISFGSVNIGTEWNKVALAGSLTGTAAASQGLYLDLRNNQVGTEIEIKNLKLEKGAVATEWCAAPEGNN